MIYFDKATKDWILSLDADERLTPKLKEEIIQITNQKKTHSAYYFYRTFMFKKTKLRFSGWQTDKIFRLFKKDKAHYTSQKTVHEKLTVNGTTGKLKNNIARKGFKFYVKSKIKIKYNPEPKQSLVRDKNFLKC